MRFAILMICCLLLAFPAIAGKRREASFIYVRGSNSNVLMSGDLDDLERVRKALKPRDRALWARTVDGKEYVVRDAAVLDELERIWKPVNELSEQLGKLGNEQGKYGELLGKLGEQVGRLGARQGELGLKLVSADDAEHAAIEREMAEIDKQMRELDKQMRVFDKPMRKLDKQMREIEPKHNAAAKQAETATSDLLARAIASGAAKPF